MLKFAYEDVLLNLDLVIHKQALNDDTSFFPVANEQLKDIIININ